MILVIMSHQVLYKVKNRFVLTVCGNCMVDYVVIMEMKMLKYSDFRDVSTALDYGLASLLLIKTDYNCNAANHF